MAFLSPALIKGSPGFICELDVLACLLWVLITSFHFTGHLLSTSCMSIPKQHKPASRILHTNKVVEPALQGRGLVLCHVAMEQEDWLPSIVLELGAGQHPFSWGW